MSNRLSATLLLCALIAPNVYAMQPDENMAAWMQQYREISVPPPPGQMAAAFDGLEGLLNTSTHREFEFTIAWLRYLTMVELHDEHVRAARFLQSLAQQRPSSWTRGAAIVAEALARSRAISLAYIQRMFDDKKHPLLALNLLAMYELTQPQGLPGESQAKNALVSDLAGAWGPRLDASGLRALANWHYRFDSPVRPRIDPAPLQLALGKNRSGAMVASLAHYYQQLIANDALPQGLHWLDALQVDPGTEPARALIRDLLHTTRQNQQRFEQAAASLRTLRQDAPASLQLALAESLLQFLNPVGSARQSRQTLVDFIDSPLSSSDGRRVLVRQHRILRSWVGHDHSDAAQGHPARSDTLR